MEDRTAALLSSGAVVETLITIIPNYVFALLLIAGSVLAWQEG